MRELKFRAWDGKKVQQITDLTDLEQGNSGYVTYEDGSYNRIGAYPIMQFTGLKDKNGREIYEFDVLKLGQDSYGVVRTVKVYWSETYACWEIEIDGSDYDLWEWAKNSEIIGNLHQNPELLGEK